MNKSNLLYPFFLPLFLLSNLFSQQQTQNINVTDNETQLNWGYSYDSTCVYLENLEKSSYVKIDSIGTIVFPVVYPQTRQMDELSLIETADSIKFQIVRKQLATIPVN